MKRLLSIVLFSCLAAILFMDTIGWSSTRFACSTDILNKSGLKIASKAVTIKIDLPLPVVFWRKYGTAKFDISSNQYTSLASQIDENYRITFSNQENNQFNGYIYLLTLKAELRYDKTDYYLDCDIIEHSSMLPDPISTTFI